MALGLVLERSFGVWGFGIEGLGLWIHVLGG